MQRWELTSWGSRPADDGPFVSAIDARAAIADAVRSTIAAAIAAVEGLDGNTAFAYLTTNGYSDTPTAGVTMKPSSRGRWIDKTDVITLIKAVGE
jgi:hypothetical protein